MSYWSEIRNNHEEVHDGSGAWYVTHIDAWRTSDSMENGVTIAKIYITHSGEVITAYIDNLARTDDYAQVVIYETVAAMRKSYEQFVRQISIVWHVDDVLSLLPTITTKQASEILREVKHNHDASIGVNLDTIKATAVQYLQRQIREDEGGQ